MKSKTLIITREKTGKRWRIIVEGSDHNLRVFVQDSLRLIAQGNNAQIINGGDPFGGQQMKLASVEADEHEKI